MGQPEQFKGKDFSANPDNINRTGANKGSRWMKTRLREMLEADDGALRNDILVALVKAAKSGKTDAIREILDRIDGKVTQEVEQKTVLEDNRIDESKLSDEDLRALAEIQRRSRAI